MQLHIPEQTINLSLDTYALGRIQIAGREHRIELYPVNTKDDVVEDLIDELFGFAVVDGPLATTTIDGVEYYLAVMPVCS